MISHKHKFIFVHINKTAGTSLSEILRKYAESYKAKYKHLSIDSMLSDHTKDYFKFAFVRNSWDRFFSLYQYRVKTNQTMLKKNPISFKSWAKKIYEMDPYYYNTPDERQVRMLSTQFNWISDVSGNKLVDFIGRFENLQEDFNIICDKIGIPQQKLPCKNATKHKHYTECYDDETREIVAEKYAKDIEMFGYEFGE